MKVEVEARGIVGGHVAEIHRFDDSAGRYRHEFVNPDKSRRKLDRWNDGTLASPLPDRVKIEYRLSVGDMMNEAYLFRDMDEAISFFDPSRFAVSGINVNDPWVKFGFTELFVSTEGEFESEVTALLDSKLYFGARMIG